MKRLTAIPTLVLVVFTIAPGCFLDFVATESPPLLQTDRLEYVATYQSGAGSYGQYSFTILAQMRNPGPGPMYLDRCYPDSRIPIYGVPIENDQRLSGYSRAWGCVGHQSPIVVAPGEIRLDTLRINGPTAWDHLTGEPLGVMEGRFRIVYSTACPNNADCPSPRAVYRSESFSVTVNRDGGRRKR